MYCVLRMHRSVFLSFISLPDYCFILVDRVDPDEMPPKAAFHLALHCLPGTHVPYLQVSRLRMQRLSEKI